MKIILQILLGDETDVLLTFEFSDLIDFEEFLRKWFKYCTAKEINAKINIHGATEQ